MDDGDVRPAGELFALKGRSAPKPRLAWRPWARGLVLGVLVGAALVFAYFLWRMASIPMPSKTPFSWGLKDGDD